MAEWLYNNQPLESLPSDCVGFVYLITNTINDKKYVGKKLSTFAKTRQKTVKLKNGTKKRKKIKSRVESDWKTYYGSSEALKKDLEDVGEAHFKREILHLCASKAACSYLEMKEQILREVLLKPNSYYNGFVGGKIHRNHLKDLHLEK